MMVQTSCNVNKRPLDVRGRSVRTRRGSSVTDGGRSHPICCHGAGPTDRPGSSRRKSSVADGFCQTINDDKQHDVMRRQKNVFTVLTFINLTCMMSTNTTYLLQHVNTQEGFSF